MSRPKLIRVTTIPLSLEKLLEGQLGFMSQFYKVVAVSSEREGLERYGEIEKVSTHYLPLTRKITPFKDLNAIIRLYSFFKKEKPLMVHTHTPKAGFVGMVSSFLAGVPLRLHTVAGLPLTEASGLKRVILNWVEKLTYKLSTNIYPNSKGLNDFIISNNFAKPNKLKIIGNGSSNGIDTNYFSREYFSAEVLINKKKELNIPSSDVVFLFVGRLVKDKGINELVKAFEMLQKKNKNCSLLLIGDYEADLDPISDRTKEQIESNDKIITTGFQDDVRIFYALSDVFVFPSYREGFPNVVMQAGAMNLPCIVSNINGCNEIIQNDINGLIINKKSISELQKAMEILIDNNPLREKLSSNSRKMIEKRFERSIFWNDLLEEYQLLQNNL